MARTLSIEVSNRTEYYKYLRYDEKSEPIQLEGEEEGVRRKRKDRRCIKFELVEAVNNSGNRKAPDLASLLVELYEYGGSSVKLQTLHSLSTDCSTTKWPNFRCMFYRTSGAKKKKKKIQ
jgi:hypothetical protein